MERDRDGALGQGEWIEAMRQDAAGQDAARQDAAGERPAPAPEPVTWYVHRDGLVEAAAFADGRAPAFFVVGQRRPYPTQAEARQVLARSL